MSLNHSNFSWRFDFPRSHPREAYGGVMENKPDQHTVVIYSNYLMINDYIIRICPAKGLVWSWTCGSWPGSLQVPVANGQPDVEAVSETCFLGVPQLKHRL